MQMKAIPPPQNHCRLPFPRVSGKLGVRDCSPRSSHVPSHRNNKWKGQKMLGPRLLQTSFGPNQPKPNATKMKAAAALPRTIKKGMRLVMVSKTKLSTYVMCPGGEDMRICSHGRPSWRTPVNADADDQRNAEAVKN
jgi:hypothetical protein